jgi:hypothetical protein
MDLHSEGHIQLWPHRLSSLLYPACRYGSRLESRRITLIVCGVDHHRRGVLAIDVVEDAGGGLKYAAGVVLQL